MAGIAAIRRDVTKELKANLGTSKLDASGLVVFHNVFDITIGLFAKSNARQSIDVWSSAKFRRFILVQTAKIAREASKHAKHGIISGVTFNRAALLVMRRTNKTCHVKVEGGVIKDIPPAGHIMRLKNGRQDGDVCSVFLATQDFS